MATHKKDLAQRFNKRIIHIEKGKIVEIEDPKQKEDDA